MQRRNHGSVGSTAAISAATPVRPPTGTRSGPLPTPAIGSAGSAGHHHHNNSNNNSGSISNWCLLLIALLLTATTYFLPQVEQMEVEVAAEALRAEQKLEDGMRDWWGRSQEEHPPDAGAGVGVGSGTRSTRTSAEATARMLEHGSSWVDGEKKLKAKLKELAKRQAQGKDLGVPVATRWVGDDIPVWAGEGVDVEAWRAKIQVRYDEMQKDEERWREMVKATLESDARG